MCVPKEREVDILLYTKSQAIHCSVIDQSCCLTGWPKLTFVMVIT